MLTETSGKDTPNNFTMDKFHGNDLKIGQLGELLTRSKEDVERRYSTCKYRNTCLNAKDSYITWDETSRYSMIKIMRLKKNYMLVQTIIVIYITMKLKHFVLMKKGVNKIKNNNLFI